MPKPKLNWKHPGRRAIVEHKCPRCGKIFVAAPYHVYKHNGRLFCTYGCYNAHLNEIEEKQRRRKE